MHKTLPLLVTLFITFLTFAQAPEGLNYQGLVRDDSGNILSSQPVGMAFAIKQGATTGTVIYSETWTVNTNIEGVVTVAIGSGMSSDDFSTIDWSNGSYFLETSIDIAGGTNYVLVGSSQLLSVPYALNAKTAGNGLPTGQAGDILYHDGTTWQTLPRGTDGQILTLSGGIPTWSNQCVNIFYLDADNDGFGDATMLTVACVAPTGYVAVKGDCDDTNANINPDATEICNDGIDNDCDGLVDSNDPDATGTSVWYLDSDSDGYGNDSVTLQNCSQPSGYVVAGGDCNDLDASINPGAVEICNDGIDNDCDGLTDAEDTNTTGGTTWYLDSDLDGFGLDSSTTTACSQPPGYAAVGGDCNDSDSNSYPGAVEICNDGIDNDCDGLTDDEDTNTSGGTAWYLDNDNDGYGIDSNVITACSQPAGYASVGGDCNDSDLNVYPGAVEICNDGIDNDCDGLTDDEDTNTSGGTTWYRDSDNDGFGLDSDTTIACGQPVGYVSNSGDCNDNDAAVRPGAQEICDGKDNDCDGLTDGDDPSLVGGTIWYRDADFDGYGNPNLTTSACTQPPGYVSNNLDCNDLDQSINPDAFEIIGDNIDNNCNGEIDEQPQ